MFRITTQIILGCAGAMLLCGPTGCSEQRGSNTPPAKLPTANSNERFTRPGTTSDPKDAISSTVPGITTDFRFSEIGREAGFEFQRYDDMRGQRRILEVNGGGVAVFDYDQDGWLDVFMTNGCRLPLIDDTHETPGKLFRNLTDHHFRDTSETSGLRQFGFCYGCAVADINEDGFEDLYLTAIGANQFWINHGDGTFSEIAAQNGTLTGRWGSSAAFADLNGDNRLDLYVANYLDESDSHPRLCPEPNSPDGYEGCSPAIFKGVPDTLFLSDGSGGYINGTEAAGLNSLPGKALGVAICDLGGDSRPEIFVANDGEPNFLLTIEGLNSPEPGIRHIRLTDGAMAASAALNDLGYAQANMGIAAADLDRNGSVDIFLTHFFGDTNTLYLNRSQQGVLLFEDATRQSRLGPPSRSKLGFGVAAIDVDYDGWKDLIVANGHVDDRSWMKAPQPFRMTAQVFRNQKDASFQEVSGGAGSYFETPRLGRGLAVGDFDRDGRQDVVISNQLDPSVILLNATPSQGASISLRLIGTSANRTPIGAKIEVEGVVPILEEQLVGGGSFQAASAHENYFGGLSKQLYDVVIQWPDGIRQRVQLTPGHWTIPQGRSPSRPGY